MFNQKSPSGRIPVKMAYICAAVTLLLGTMQVQAETVVTDHVVSGTKQMQHDVPITFGQVFKAGDVPRGVTLTASLDGQPVPLQVDVKATNPDGSLRHAVLTTMPPSLPGGTRMPLTLSTDTGQGAPPSGPAPASTRPPPRTPARAPASTRQRAASAALPAPMTTRATSPPITLSQLLDTDYDARVSLIIDGRNYTADARKLLQTANDADACKAWGPQCSVWLSGPLVGAWVVNGSVTTADGTAQPNLHVYFAIRAYAGVTPGIVGDVRTDIIVENSSAFAPQAQPRYTATLTSGTADFSSPDLTQYGYTRWHKVLWWNGSRPKVYLEQDTQYLQASKAVPRYLPLKPDKSFLKDLRQSCAPLDNCDQTKKMANTGAQPAIGPLPRWTSVYLLDPDIHAYHWMLANTDALGAYSIHYRDTHTGYPVSIRQHPYVTIANWASAKQKSRQDSTKGIAYKADLLQGCSNNTVVHTCSTGWYGTGNPNKWDNAHQPAESYVPYMVTGDYYYMSELAFGASHNEIWSNEAYRGFTKGLIDGAHGQVRAKAWVLREMVNAAWLLPDRHPLKSEFTADVDNSLADWNKKYTDTPDVSPLRLMAEGAIYDVHGGHRNGIAPWQHNFLTWSAGHAAELGFSGAARFRDWLAEFEIGLMTDWQSNPAHGFCWLEASAYSIQVKDSSGNWLPSYTAVYGSNWPDLDGLACNSPDMVAELGKLRNKPTKAGEMAGYPDSATGFPANFQVGVAAAADSGLRNAHEAWRIFQSRSVKPTSPHGYNNYPNFAVLPRTVTH